MAVHSDSRMLEWLESLGYAVADVPPEQVFALFLAEAKKWGIAPKQLEQWIREAEESSGDGGANAYDDIVWRPLAALTTPA